MWRYVVIGTALLAAILVMSLIKGWQRRRALARGDNLDDLRGISAAHVAGGIAGLVVLMVGVLLLELNASSPEGSYQPAKIVDGKIVSGGFKADGE